MALLRVENMTHYFGGLRAVHNYNLDIEPGQIRGLIGPNGAGKTTIFNLITGIYQPTEGTDHCWMARTSPGFSPMKSPPVGLGRTFQNLRLWRHMTVLEHVKMARYSRLDLRAGGGLLRHARTASRGGARSRKRPIDLLEAGRGRPLCGPDGGQPALRRPAAGGNGPGPGHRAQGALPGRTHGRHEPGGTGADDGDHPPGPCASWAWPSF